MLKFTNNTFFLLFLFSLCGHFLWCLTPFIAPLISADSQSYLSFSPTRTVGYPAFLWLVKKIFGTYNAVFWVQPLFLSAASAYCAHQLHTVKAPLWLCFGFIGASALNYNIPTSVFSIMTEASHLTLIMLIFSETISILKTNKGWGRLSFWIGLNILVRPVNYALLSVIALLVWIKRPIWRESLKIISCLTVLWFLGGLSHKITHGFFGTESFFGFNMIGKVAFITKDNHKNLILRKMHELVTPYQKNSESCHHFYTEYLLKSQFYDYIRYIRLKDIAGSLYKDDLFLKKISFEAIALNPKAYLYDAFLNYSAVWQLADLSTNNEILKYKKFYKKAFYLTKFEPHFMEFIRKRVSLKWWKNEILVYSIRGVLGILCIITLYFIGNAFIRRQSLSLWEALGAIGAISVQSHHVLIGLLQAGLPRYLFAHWPSLMLCCVCLFMMLRNYYQALRKVHSNKAL